MKPDNKDYLAWCLDIVIVVVVAFLIAIEFGFPAAMASALGLRYLVDLIYENRKIVTLLERRDSGKTSDIDKSR